MPVKSLPIHPSLDHLKSQARALRKAHSLHDLAAFQRLREFFPRCGGLSDADIAVFNLRLSDAYLAIAREYGFPSWTKLKDSVGKGTRPAADVPMHERIVNPLFRQAVDLMDVGDVAGLRGLLEENPDLVHRRVEFENMNYFQNPTLLSFVAENPIRHGRMPENVVEVARALLDAGATEGGYTLGLVCSGRIPREMGKQVALIDLLCDYRVDPTKSLPAALSHGEFEAVRALLRRGAAPDIRVYAALGDREDVARLMPSASGEDRHYSLALAVQHGRLEVVRLLLEAGEDPSRYNPMGLHSHSTPLHQAALSGRMDVVRLLVEAGASLALKDTLYDGAPLEWAEYAGQLEVAEYLRSRIERRA